MPCRPARARELLREGKAVVAKRLPFTIRLRHREEGAVQPIALKIDPGSKTTGMALVRETEGEAHALWLGEIEHRGKAIHEAMEQRANYRRRRRSANLRYRAPRFDNRRPAKGTLPPSLRHRVETVVSWAHRLQRLAPVTRLAMELVRFDTQAMESPGIEGVEYQQGTLAGYELREYLLEKWGRKCAYCSKEKVPLQVEHIRCEARGGSKRPSNLTVACGPCNQRKGSRPVEEFLAKKPEVLARVLSCAKAPLRDAAAVNATRWATNEALRSLGLPVETASGGRTKWNRSRFGVPKTHALDALCVGLVEAVHDWHGTATLAIKATGRGAYQRTRVTAQGFPRGYLMRGKSVRGFRTGDLVSVVVPSGKKTGRYVGRIAVRATGSFNVQTHGDVVQGISWRHCHLLQRADGYHYSPQGAASSPGSRCHSRPGSPRLQSIGEQRR